jgi:polyphosphate kinase
VSETIRVISIVGRFLEHSRVYYFGNGCDPARRKAGDAGDTCDDLYLGSADLMPRNLNRRVEVLFPIESPALKAQLRDEILPLYLRDTVKARVLRPDGTYVRARPGPGEPEIDSQATLLAGATALARP